MSAPTLTSILTTTARAVLGDDLSAAHTRFKLGGTGEPFFTKWFWAVSLADPAPRRRPLILDQRVRDVLHHSLGNDENWSRPRGSNGYVDFVDLVHGCAHSLHADYPHIDAEKLEWLMFDRHNHESVSEPCLSGWPS